MRGILCHHFGKGRSIINDVGSYGLIDLCGRGILGRIRLCLTTPQIALLN
jgi:hypothetical protein